MHQSNSISQGLPCSKSLLSQQNLTIPRLELVSCYILDNLLDNAKITLTGYSKEKFVAWNNISVVLQWIQGNGNYKQLVKNHAKKINGKKEITGQYVSTTKNPADIGSRGMSLTKMGEFWWKEPGWFRDSDSWSSDIKTKETAEIESEARIIKDMMTSTTLKSDVVDEILQRYSH